MTALERAYAALPDLVIEEATGIVAAGEWFDEERTDVAGYHEVTRRLTVQQIEQLRREAR